METYMVQQRVNTLILTVPGHITASRRVNSPSISRAVVAPGLASHKRRKVATQHTHKLPVPYVSTLTDSVSSGTSSDDLVHQLLEEIKGTGRSSCFLADARILVFVRVSPSSYLPHARRHQHSHNFCADSGEELSEAKRDTIDSLILKLQAIGENQVRCHKDQHKPSRLVYVSETFPCMILLVSSTLPGSSLPHCCCLLPCALCLDQSDQSRTWSECRGWRLLWRNLACASVLCTWGCLMAPMLCPSIRI